MSAALRDIKHLIKGAELLNTFHEDRTKISLIWPLWESLIFKLLLIWEALNVYLTTSNLFIKLWMRIHQEADVNYPWWLSLNCLWLEVTLLQLTQGSEYVTLTRFWPGSTRRRQTFTVANRRTNEHLYLLLWDIINDLGCLMTTASKVFVFSASCDMSHDVFVGIDQ